MAPSTLRGKVKIVAISGKARSGKDTLARALVGQFGYRAYSFAEPLYKMLNVLPYLEHVHSVIPTEEKEQEHKFYGVSIRRMLQTLGTEWGRNLVGRETWVRVLQDKLERKLAILSTSAFVISDLRFQNEANWVHANGGIVVRIYRDPTVLVAPHVSEDGIADAAIDVGIENNTTIEALCQHARNLNDLADQRRTAALTVSV